MNKVPLRDVCCVVYDLASMLNCRYWYTTLQLALFIDKHWLVGGRTERWHLYRYEVHSIPRVLYRVFTVFMLGSRSVAAVFIMGAHWQ